MPASVAFSKSNRGRRPPDQTQDLLTELRTVPGGSQVEAHSFSDAVRPSVWRSASRADCETRRYPATRVGITPSHQLSFSRLLVLSPVPASRLTQPLSELPSSTPGPRRGGSRPPDPQTTFPRSTRQEDRSAFTGMASSR